jgi:hypothetical protein
MLSLGKLFLGVAVLCSTALSARIATAHDQVVRLGGVRDVTATISESKDGYRVMVEMLPVKAFDPPTNKRLNLAKARAYAIQGLAKSLNAGNPAQSEVRGVQVQEIGLSGGMYRLVLLVPHLKAQTASTPKDSPARENVATPSPTKPKKEEPTLTFTAEPSASDFLNRRSDYLDTIAQLQEQFCADGVAAEKKATQQDDFYSAIGDLEERAEAAFKALTAQIAEDKLLLSVERDELFPVLSQSRTKVLGSLKAAVARFDKRQEKTKETTK